jgi:hypothetical protein
MIKEDGWKGNSTRFDKSSELRLIGALKVKTEFKH